MIDAKAITQRLRLALIRAGDVMLGDAPKREPGEATPPGRIADSESLAEGRSQPLFRPRQVRTPKGTDWS